MKKIIVLLSLFFSCITVYAQLTVNSGTLSPTAYLTNGLLGSGVQVSNVRFNNQPGYSGNQLGTFNYNGNQMPFNYGLILGNGAVNGMIGPNNSGSHTGGISPASTATDSDLQNLAGTSIYDIGKLEFDFIPSGSTVSFSFVFASEEYNEFVCSSFNDVFGFFVTGSNPSGPAYNSTNLATVPGTNIPITINTINNGSVGSSGSMTNCNSADPNWINNSQYFAGVLGNQFQSDGATNQIDVTFPVVCGETYQFKIAIADGFDSSYDSWVMIKGGSFTSQAVNVQIATISGINQLLEGCGNADIHFTRPSSMNQTPLSISYTIGGTATQGVDYPNLTNPITFPIGIDTVTLSINAFADGIPEGTETIDITVMTINDCGDTIISTGTLIIYDDPVLTINSTDVTVQCWGDSIPLTTTATSSNLPFTYQWSNGANTQSTLGSINSNTTIPYYVTATDACGYSIQDTVYLTANQTLAITDIIQYPASACNSDGITSATVTGNVGLINYYWYGPGNNPNGPHITASAFIDVPSGWYYFSATDNVCSVSDSIFVEQNNPPTAVIETSQLEGCAPFNVVLNNASQNANNYSWNIGNGFYNVGNNTDPQSATLLTTTTIQLVASLDNCPDTTELTIIVTNCGCTNPAAINYNPIATIDNGSCIFPNPIITPSNVFTPDGDGINDSYVLLIENVKEIDFKVFNRWGNLVYEYLGNQNPTWDGKSDGTKVNDGTYFYTFIAKSYNDQEVSGHGFIQLINK